MYIILDKLDKILTNLDLNSAIDIGEFKDKEISTSVTHIGLESAIYESCGGSIRTDMFRVIYISDETNDIQQIYNNLKSVEEQIRSLEGIVLAYDFEITFQGITTNMCNVYHMDFKIINAQE